MCIGTPMRGALPHTPPTPPFHTPCVHAHSGRMRRTLDLSPTASPKDHPIMHSAAVLATPHVTPWLCSLLIESQLLADQASTPSEYGPTYPLPLALGTRKPLCCARPNYPSPRNKGMVASSRTDTGGDATPVRHAFCVHVLGSQSVCR